jgi:hypothetical protein
MKVVKFVSIASVLLGSATLACAQQADQTNKPSIVVEKREKPKRAYRTIRVSVKIRPTIPWRVRSFSSRTPRRQDRELRHQGRHKFAFHDPINGINYELLAKRGELTP